jgi:hypothetical protein
MSVHGPLLGPWKQAFSPYLLWAGGASIPLVERLSRLVSHPSLQDAEYQDVLWRMAIE